MSRVCSICLTNIEYEPETPEEEAYFLPCEHIYHEECILKWLEKNLTCPCCRIPVFITSPQELISYNKFLKQYSNETEACLSFMSIRNIERPAKFDYSLYRDEENKAAEEQYMQDYNLAASIDDESMYRPLFDRQINDTWHTLLGSISIDPQSQELNDVDYLHGHAPAVSLVHNSYFAVATDDSFNLDPSGEYLNLADDPPTLTITATSYSSVNLITGVRGPNIMP